MLHLDETELSDLAQFFARRYPGAQQRKTLLSAAKIPDPKSSTELAAWVQVLQTAQQNPSQMRRLTRTARRTDPKDDNLQDICRLLEPPSRHIASAAALAGGVGSALVVAVLIAPLLVSPDASADMQTAPVEATVAVLGQPASSPPIHPASPAAVTPPADAVPVAVSVAAPVDPPSPAPEAPQPQDDTTVDAPTASTAAAVGRCRGRAEELIGYWYAGAQSPGSSGDTITAPVTTNVRADYPDVHNDFNARADRRCLLVAGDSITLSADPIAVPGDRYWVPLYGGDLL